MNNLKVGLQAGSMPVAAYFLVSIFLSNCHTCLYGGAIQSRFNIRPMPIERYLMVEEISDLPEEVILE